jgi:hypothetical protein
MRVSVVSVAAAVAAVTLVTGCGTSEKPVTKAQYEQRLAKIGQGLYQAANALTQSSNTQIFIDAVSHLEDVVADSANDLDGVRPPGEAAQRANDRLVHAYRDLKGEFEKVKDARRQSFRQAINALQRLQKSQPAQETLRAAQQLRKLGYTFPASASIGSA